MQIQENKLLFVCALFLLCLLYVSTDAQVSIQYHSKSSKSGYNFGLINGNNFDKGNNYYTVIRLNSNTFQVGDTTIVPLPNETRSVIYSLSSTGKVRFIKFCQGTNNSGIYCANVIGEKVYLIYGSTNSEPIYLFDGTQIANIHKTSIWISVLDTNGNHLVTKEVCHTDSVNSSFFSLGYITGNMRGEIFLSSFYDGFWNFQGTQKHHVPRKNKFNDPITKNLVIKFDSNANIVWINDSVTFTGLGVRKLFYSDENHQLIIGINFSDTLWLPDGSIKKATDPLVANANSLFFASLDDNGTLKWCTHYNSGGCDVTAKSPNKDSTYNVVISTIGNNLRIDGDSIPWLYYAYVIKLDSQGKSKLLYGATSEDNNYYINEVNGQNESKFLNYSCTKTSYALQDSSSPYKTGLYFSTIWHLKENKILGKLIIKGNTNAGGSVMYQIGDFTYLQVGGNDSIWINNYLIKADTALRNGYFVRLPTYYFTGLEPNKLMPKNSSNTTISPRLTLFPNPAKGKVTASWQPGNQYPTQISICDGMGNALLTQTASAFTNVVSFNTSNLKPGLYFVLFENKLWKDGRTLLIQE